MAFDAPEQSFPFLRKLLPKRLQPVIRGLRKRWQRPTSLDEPFRSVFAYTQAHSARQQNLVRLASKIEQSNVPGTIVECGVLDGGTAALMAYMTASSARPVHLFDSWEGLPLTTAEDGEGGKVWGNEVVGSQQRVSAIMHKLNIDRSRLHFHKGWFAETFPKADIEMIALLHVDGDFYNSVKLTLDTWVPHMSSGGFIQIDDYEIFIGCTRAVDEFLSKRPDLKLESVFGSFAKTFFIKC